MRGRVGTTRIDGIISAVNGAAIDGEDALTLTNCCTITGALFSGGGNDRNNTSDSVGGRTNGDLTLWLVDDTLIGSYVNREVRTVITGAVDGDTRD